MSDTNDMLCASGWDMLGSSLQKLRQILQLDFQDVFRLAGLDFVQHPVHPAAVLKAYKLKAKAISCHPTQGSFPKEGYPNIDPKIL